MKPTRIPSLIAVAVFCALASGILVTRFYSDLQSQDLVLPLLLLTLALIEFYLGVWVKGKIDRGLIGQDRSQVQPLQVARLLVIGTASAWFGAILGGFYAGLGWYVASNMSTLAAAAHDAPAAFSGIVASALLSIAGWRLEQSCGSPPPTDEQEETSKVVWNS